MFILSWHLLQEKVVDLLPDECPESEELPVDPVEDRLEEVSLPGILAVKQFQQGEDELLVYDLFADAGLKVGALKEPEEELVDELQINERFVGHE